MMFVIDLKSALFSMQSNDIDNRGANQLSPLNVNNVYEKIVNVKKLARLSSKT